MVAVVAVVVVQWPVVLVLAEALAVMLSTTSLVSPVPTPMLLEPPVPVTQVPLVVTAEIPPLTPVSPPSRLLEVVVEPFWLAQQLLNSHWAALVV
mgnify:CR=1 FL=1